IGAKDKEDAEKYVSLGDFACFDTEFEYLTDTVVKAKAIDDRAGVSILLNLIKEVPEFDTYFCFTTQEEVGLRGAKIVTNKILPDIALVLEATTASDVFGADEENYVTTLGNGAVISFADRSMIADKSYFEWLYNLAFKENIKVQKKKAIAGGNDSGAIHLANGGIPTIAISVPTRYIHSPSSIASLEDIDEAEKLARVYLQKIGEFIG
ncbi:MAG: M28 family peptidase, partial [Clostridia bacterium]|nr:M28 family peptidase [Clostridia bacterium]